MRIGNPSRGMALLFTLAMLALISLVGTAFVSLAQLDSALGATHVHLIRAQIAAESGVAYALSRLRDDMPGGPLAEEVLQAWGYDYAAMAEDPAAGAGQERVAYALDLRLPNREERVSGMVDDPAAPRTTYTVEVADESGKLNLNDSNMPMPVVDGDSYGYAQGRLTAVLGILLDLVLEPGVAAPDGGPLGGGDGGLRGGGMDRESRGRRLARSIFLDPAHGRAAFPGDRFPAMADMDRALRQAGLTDAEVLRLHDYVTIHSVADTDLLRPTLELYGGRVERLLGGDPVATVGVNLNDPDWQGGNLADCLGETVESNLAIQGRNYQLESRCPVNINTARLELIQALIQPVRGIFLEEGPAEWQSSEHYGWWSTGLGTPDANVFNMGRLRLTQALTPAIAARLARAIYDRIHGTATYANGYWNEDLTYVDMVDADGDGWPDPQPFSTWEEFREFLRDGVYLDYSGGDGFEVAPDKDIPPPYDAAHGFVDPHQISAGSADAWYFDKYKSKPVQLINTSGSPMSWFTAFAGDWWNRYYTQAMQDALFANANPNSLLNDFNPNANVYLMVDKGQLAQPTTEFCFEPTGVFRVTSRGRQWGMAALLGEAKVRAYCRLFDRLRMSTQADFMGAMNSAEDLSFRFSSAVEPADSYLGEVQHTTLTPAGRFTLQSYPEPYFFDAAQERAIANCRADGSLMLATYEVLREGPPTHWDWHWKPASSLCLAHFNGNNAQPLQLDYVHIACPNPNVEAHAAPGNWLRAGTVLPTADAAASASVPGGVYPDGAYSEKDRVLAYTMGNLDAWMPDLGQPPYYGQRGLVSFWIKPNFHTGIPTRMRKFLSGPSKSGGRWGIQQLPALYYCANPGSNECNGWLCKGLQGQSVFVKEERRFTQINFKSPFDGFQYGRKYRNYWIPSRCLAFGFAWEDPGDYYHLSFLEGAMTSRGMTTDYPLAQGNVTRDQDKEYYQTMPGHQWSHVELNWKLEGNRGFKGFNMCFNGKYVSDELDDWNAGGGRGGIAWNRYRWDYVTQLRLHSWNTNATWEWLRFGELPEGVAGASSGASPYFADSTIDELLGNNGYSEAVSNNAARQAGRYYAFQETRTRKWQPYVARYESPEIRLKQALGASARELRAVAWTIYRPRNNRNPDTGNGDRIQDNIKGVVVNPGDKPDPCVWRWAADTQPGHEAWDPIAVDVRMPSGGEERSVGGGSWYFGDHGNAAKCFTYPGGSVNTDMTALRYAPGESFQYRVYFHLAENQALFESPVLDDVTFTFWLTSARIEAWEAEAS